MTVTASSSSSSEIPDRCEVCFESEPEVTYFNHACCHNIICTDCAGRLDACPFARHSWDGTQQNQNVMRLADAEQGAPGTYEVPIDLAARDNALAGVDAAAQRIGLELDWPEGHRQNFADMLIQWIRVGHTLEEAEQLLLDDIFPLPEFFE